MMVVETSCIEGVTEKINSKNAKKIALILVIGFVCYHGILHVQFGTNSCKWLLGDGRYKGDQEWQPYGCMLHLYTKVDTRRCLQYIAYYGPETHFVFIGDSRIRELYSAFIKQLIQDEQIGASTSIYKNLSYVDKKLKIKINFIWAPSVSNKMVEHFKAWEVSHDPPSVIVVGSALWSILSSNASLAAVDEYQVNLTRLVQPIDRLHKKTKTLWVIQEPVNKGKLKPEWQIISNELINLYNSAAVEVLTHSAAEIWWSIRLVGEGMIEESPDGIHVTERSLRHDTQILLNMYCNDYMNFNDGTCCSSVESRTTLQIVTFVILTICVTIASTMILYRLILKCRGHSNIEYQSLPSNELQTPGPVSSTNKYFDLFKTIATMAIIMLYFFICDRTNFFMKENKYYSEFSFWLPIGYVTVLGLFFTEESKFTKVLHRDQLNEWKGWMQLVILVYQVTGANRVLIINMHIKVLISSYLFLLGYEQFKYVWHRNEVSIVSFFKMLFQLNFLTVTLCLCMNRPYQFYYFAPLLSFWYLMIYCFVAFPPHITAQTSENNVMFSFYLLIKFICFFSVITILFMSEVFFEKIFVTRPWKALFVTTDDDIHEWWLRWKTDRYSVMYGMLFGVVMVLAQRYNIFDDNNHSNLFSRGIALSTTLTAVIGIGAYVIFTCLCRSEMDCTEIHSYIVFIPILSYILLRNLSGFLRTRYSSLFAWFGEISLELFISQYHIWLAADTHGVLVLIPGYPVLNLIITSYIYMCASHELYSITKVLLPYAVPNDWKLVLRNFILFIAILVPIGINDGMF